MGPWSEHDLWPPSKRLCERMCDSKETGSRSKEKWEGEERQEIGLATRKIHRNKYFYFSSAIWTHRIHMQSIRTIYSLLSSDRISVTMPLRTFRAFRDVESIRPSICEYWNEVFQFFIILMLAHIMHDGRPSRKSEHLACVKPAIFSDSHMLKKHTSDSF